MTYMQKIVRSAGDPKLQSTGPSSRSGTYRLGEALGWLSIGLGLFELVAPGPVSRGVGMEGREALIRAYGAREIAAGVMTLSTEKDIGLWSRVVGDGIDLVTLASALDDDNPRKERTRLGIALVLGVTLLDLYAAQAVTTRRRLRRGSPRDYGGRSGFPRGVERSRGLARVRAA